MSVRARSIRPSLAILAILLSSAPARAHLGHVITSAERYLKLDVSAGRARVVVSLTLGAGEGARVLAEADSDGDRRVSESERDAYLAQWAQGLARELPASVDGEPVELAWGEPYMEPIGPVVAVPVTVELVAPLELEGRQTVRIEDRMVRREIYDRTDVAFRARDGAELIATAVGGEAPREVIEDTAYDGAFMRGEAVPLVAIVRTPERPARVPWLAIAAFAALGVISAAVLVWNRRRSRSQRAQRS